MLGINRWRTSLDTNLNTKIVVWQYFTSLVALLDNLQQFHDGSKSWQNLSHSLSIIIKLKSLYSMVVWQSWKVRNSSLWFEKIGWAAHNDERSLCWRVRLFSEVEDCYIHIFQGIMVADRWMLWWTGVKHIWRRN